MVHVCRLVPSLAGTKPASWPPLKYGLGGLLYCCSGNWALSRRWRIGRSYSCIDMDLPRTGWDTFNIGTDDTTAQHSTTAYTARGLGRTGQGGQQTPLNFGADVRNCIWCRQVRQCQSNGNDHLSNSTTSRGGVKINVSCYMIKRKSLIPLMKKMVPKRLYTAGWTTAMHWLSTEDDYRPVVQ